MKKVPDLNKFTTKAKDVIRGAHEIAMERGQKHVSPMHLMVALLLEDDSVVLSVLESLNVDCPLVVDLIFEVIEGESSSVMSPAFQMFLTADLVSGLEASVKIAKTMKDEFVGTEHLLIAMLALNDPDLNEIISRFPELRRESVIDILVKIKNGEKKVDKKKTLKYLPRFAKNLTEMAFENKLDPVIGRASEVERVIQIISRRQKNNPLLVGGSGVGKTSVVEALAQKIVLGEVPDFLKRKELLSLDLGLLVAGTKFRGEFEDRMKGVLKEVKDSKGSIVLFIDEVHMIVGAGSAGEGQMDASNILKPDLARGELNIIGATTYDEYQKHIVKDAALNRRFQAVDVPEPSRNDAVKILEGLREKYEIFHGVEISDEAIEAAVDFSMRFLPDRLLPDKAIDLIDEAGSYSRINLESKPEKLIKVDYDILALRVEKEALVKKKNTGKKVEIIDKKIADLMEDNKDIIGVWSNEREISEQIKDLKKTKNDLLKTIEIASSDGDIPTVAELKYVELPALEKVLKGYAKKLVNLSKRKTLNKEVIGAEDVARVVASWTGVPLEKMVESEVVKLAKLEELLEKKIIGQNKAISKISAAVRRSRAGLSDPKRPIGSFMFVGPTGVGKTELVKKLAEVMFDSEDSLIRVDMSELMESHSVSKLIGSPPGYVGFDEGGSLTTAVKKRPYSIILFDEVEKAHPDVFNILLQVLDDGNLKDSKGRDVNFKNSIIVLTSNVGANEAKVMNKIGFFEDAKVEKKEKKDSEVKYNEAKENLMESLKRQFRMEFLNRLDEVVVFDALSEKSLEKVADLEIRKINKRLLGKGISVKVAKVAIDKMISGDYPKEFGARPIKRILQEKVLDKLSDYIFKNYGMEGQFSVDVKKGKFVYDFKKKVGKIVKTDVVGMKRKMGLKK